MAKTVTAMLVGIAIEEGRIRSVDDLAAAYVAALAGTEYGAPRSAICYRCPRGSASVRSTRAGRCRAARAGDVHPGRARAGWKR